MDKKRPKTAFQDFFEPEPARNRSFDVQISNLDYQKKDEIQSIRVQTAPVLMAPPD